MNSFYFRFLSRTQLNLLKFSLSLRTSSPKVEMFQQIAADRGVPKLNCPYVLEFNGKLACQIDDLDVKNLNSDLNPRLFSVDHHYGKSQNKLPAVILYGNPRNEAFATPHNALKALAEKGQIDYVYRPFIHERSAQSLRLSGKTRLRQIEFEFRFRGLNVYFAIIQDMALNCKSSQPNTRPMTTENTNPMGRAKTQTLRKTGWIRWMESTSKL